MPADVCGPFTLEQLDEFGDLDSLAFSLDSSVWTDPNVCILYNTGAVTADATLDASAFAIRSMDGDVTATGTASSDSIRYRLVDGAVTATGSASATPLRIRFNSGDVTASATASSDSFRVRLVDGAVTGNATVTGDADCIFDEELVAVEEMTGDYKEHEDDHGRPDRAPLDRLGEADVVLTALIEDAELGMGQLVQLGRHQFRFVIVIDRKVLGVLVVQQRARRGFGEEEMAFLLTVAAQLAGAIAHAEVSGGISRLVTDMTAGVSLGGLPLCLISSIV